MRGIVTNNKISTFTFSKINKEMSQKCRKEKAIMINVQNSKTDVLNCIVLSVEPASVNCCPIPSSFLPFPVLLPFTPVLPSTALIGGDTGLGVEGSPDTLTG